MNWQKLKWKPVVAGFAATLTILLIGNYLWHRTAIERPLIQVLLQDEAVKQAEFFSDGRNSRVEVEVNDVPRFAEATRRIKATVKQMQPTVEQIDFIDNSDDSLIELYDKLHFSVFEARSNGNFVELSKRFAEAVREADLTAHRLEVDGEAIYVQLHRGEAYLYRLVTLEVKAE